MVLVAQAADARVERRVEPDDVPDSIRVGVLEDVPGAAGSMRVSNIRDDGAREWGR